MYKRQRFLFLTLDKASNVFSFAKKIDYIFSHLLTKIWTWYDAFKREKKFLCVEKNISKFFKKIEKNRFFSISRIWERICQNIMFLIKYRIHGRFLHLFFFKILWYDPSFLSNFPFFDHFFVHYPYESEMKKIKKILTL